MVTLKGGNKFRWGKEIQELLEQNHVSSGVTNFVGRPR